MVGLLMCIVMYMYALVGFAFFRNVFHDNQLFCDTLAQCFATIVREGLIYGLAERFDLQEDRPLFTFSFYAAKMVFDVSFFIIITTIGLNIVFGIIVDTFSELRDSKWQIEKDMRTLCFICGIPASDFSGRDFESHCKQDHNMWSYIYFLIYLDQTSRNDLFAVELEVLKCVEAESVGWLPLNRALCLADAEMSADESRLETLLSNVHLLIDRMHREEAEKAKETERLRQKRWWEEMRHGRRASRGEGSEDLSAVLNKWPAIERILRMSDGAFNSQPVRKPSKLVRRPPVRVASGDGRTKSQLQLRPKKIQDTSPYPDLS